jgi:TAT-translocated FGD2 family F420-dependent dehydrogenase
MTQRQHQPRAVASRVDRRTWLIGAGVFAGASCKPMPRGVGGGPTEGTEARARSMVRKPMRERLVGFQLAHEQFKMRELVDLGMMAENAGFDVVTASDHFQPWQANEGHSGHAWLTLAALGERTTRVWLGTTVTCPTFRYPPPVVAEGFASLAALQPGRVFLGVGSGEALNEKAAVGEWPSWEERSERLVEATAIIRQLWTGQPVEHNGLYYKVNARLYDPPPQPIPLLMAANGPKAMRRAGQHADGLITDPKTWKEHRHEFDGGLREAGRSREATPVFVEHYVVVGDERDARAAAELWRFGPKAWKPYFDIRDPAEIERRANAEIPLEKVYADWVVSTDPDVHAKALRDLFESGATEVNVHSGQADQRRVIEFYGTKVLPRMARG